MVGVMVVVVSTNLLQNQMLLSKFICVEASGPETVTAN